MRPPLLNPLFAEINSLPGIGPKLAPLLNRLLTEAHLFELRTVYQLET
jgi:ATP-dependent DNA helicase RecG